MKLPQKLAFVDVETTGSNPRGDRVMEIGIIRVEKNKVVQTMNTLINPRVSPSEFIVNMTGINPYDLEVAPPFSDVARDVKEILDGAIFVAHNARFDYAFIKNEFLRHDVSFNARVLCTVRLARKVYPGLVRYNLDSIIERFGIECAHRHRAYDDALCLWDFYSKSMKNEIRPRLETALLELLKEPSMPPNIDQKKIKSLTDGPGVYIFMGGVNYEKEDSVSDDKSMTLYVGKSINVKDRVRSHFSSDYQSSKDLKIVKFISDIDVIETAGELGALIRESVLVKKLQPVYNRKLRRNRDMIVAMESSNNGYLSVELKRLKYVSMKDCEKVIAIFRSKLQAREFLVEQCMKNKLCPKIMGLEKTKSFCFNYQIKKCNGACMEEENKLKYNIRFIESMSRNKVSRWPFDGPVAIEESYYNMKEIHFVDKWCYLGSSLVQSNKVNFDWDIYQILKKFILKKRTDVKINRINYEDILEV